MMIPNKNGVFARQDDNYVIVLRDNGIGMKLGRYTERFDVDTCLMTSGFANNILLDDNTSQHSVLVELRNLINNPFSYNNYRTTFTSSNFENSMMLEVMHPNNRTVLYYSDDEIFTMGVNMTATYVVQRAQMITDISNLIDYDDRLIILDLIDEAINFLEGT